MDIYSTHIPYLAKAVCKLGGPVLELGCGWYSTPLIRQFTDKVLTLETNKIWKDRLAELFGDASIWYFKIFEDIEPLLIKPYQIAFVDFETPEQRIWATPKLVNTDLIICHDTEQEYWKPILKEFKYVKHFTTLKPNTSYVSNTIDVENI